MRKEILACDHCNEELREGFTLKGSLKHSCGKVPDIGGEDTELHFHEWCLISLMFPDYNLVKKRNSKAKACCEEAKDESKCDDKVFDEVEDA